MSLSEATHEATSSASAEREVPEGAALLVEGAGDERVNGYYRRAGLENRKPCYRKIGDDEFKICCLLALGLGRSASN
eukprot:m.124183 g.124183  ORF g.124183 m.124183 type:complete len:77 (+) comp9669_c0_seq3:166-396(+)